MVTKSNKIGANTKPPAKPVAKSVPNKGGGRPKGAQNKVTGEVKQMVLDALAAAGGVKYLTKQATANPKAFLTLVGKVLPLQLTGDGGGPLRVTISRDDEAL